MATEVIMPQMGFDMKEGTLVKWMKAVGDQVSKGEPLAEIETDKAVVEIEAYAAGQLRKIVIGEGTTVPVGQVIGIIGTADEDISEVQSAPVPVPTEASPRADAPEKKPAEAVVTGPKAEGERTKASPLARKEAEQRGIDIALVSGTGPAGRVTKDDVIAYSQDVSQGKEAAPVPVAAAPAPVADEVVPLSRMRQAIARNMARSKGEIPHFYATVDVDMTLAVKLRVELNEALGGDIRVSINDMVIKAAAKALSHHLMFNASFTEAGVHLKKAINIGVAIALDEGLIAPAILDCAGKSLSEIGAASSRLVERARSGVLSVDEYTNATFNVTNLGMYDVESFTAIITPPQSAALAVGSVTQVPIVKDGEVTVANRMKLTLSIDHRVADGAQAALFLAEVRGILERPMGLLA